MANPLTETLYAGSPVVADVRNIHLRKILSASLRALVFSVYPRLYQLHEAPETMGTYDPETGRMIPPWVVRSSHIWMQGHGIYLIGEASLSCRGVTNSLIESMWVDDGDVTILWLGGDADRSEMRDLLGVESAHELSTPLPVSSDMH